MGPVHDSNVFLTTTCPALGEAEQARFPEPVPLRCLLCFCETEGTRVPQHRVDCRVHCPAPPSQDRQLHSHLLSSSSSSHDVPVQPIFSQGPGLICLGMGLRNAVMMYRAHLTCVLLSRLPVPLLVVVTCHCMCLDRADEIIQYFYI